MLTSPTPKTRFKLQESKDLVYSCHAESSAPSTKYTLIKYLLNAKDIILACCRGQKA